MGKFINMLGKKFGKLKVISLNHKNEKSRHFWKCICECGKEKIVDGIDLRIGNTKSCGCIRNPSEKEYNEKLKKRLEKYSCLNPGNGCIEWQKKRRTINGYGFLNYKKNQLMAHRASWIVYNGKIPEGMYVCHTCDNPPCINPKHLFLGTHKDNMKDMKNKNRQNNGVIYGEKNHFHILKEEDVIDIKKAIHYGYTIKKISEKFKINRQTVSLIKHGKLWSHLKELDLNENSKNFLYEDKNFMVPKPKEILENMINDKIGFWAKWCKDEALKALDFKEKFERI